jgi:hypothetical protein
MATPGLTPQTGDYAKEKAMRNIKRLLTITTLMLTVLGFSLTACHEKRERKSVNIRVNTPKGDYNADIEYDDD